MKHIPLVACALLLSLVALPVAASAFFVSHRRYVTLSSPWTRRNELRSLQLGKSNGGYSSMPPLSNDTFPSPFSRGYIFKVLRRDVYPTVDLPYESNYTDVDHYFMGMALQQARRAGDRGEVPIGALVVRECNDGCGDDVGREAPADEMQPTRTRRRTFQILSAAHNRVETDVDASAHAELLALRKGARNLNNWRFPNGSRLYSTLEPCPMCLASIQAFRIDHIVYGAPDNRLGAVRTHMDLLGAARHPYHEVKSVTGGVREEECGNIVVQFFRERRRKKKEEKDGMRKLLKLPLKKSGGREGMNNRRIGFARFVKALLRRQ